MDYEKKYKEANDKVAARFGTNVAKEIFTDLYESEDEKIVDAIRKALESKIEDLGNGVTKTACINWLEKQGEQKPAWSIKEKLMLNDIIEATERSNIFMEDYQRELIDWLKSLKQRIGV